MQHIMQKSGYNYTKKTTFVHSAWLLASPGIDNVLHQKIMKPPFSAAHLRTFLPLLQHIESKVGYFVHAIPHHLTA